MRYKLILSYDGTDFFGFQRQANVPTKRTVQSELEKALNQTGWKGRSILSAGRTDSGVHAKGQVVAFDLEWCHSERDLQAALNARLPADIAVKYIEETSSGFHPRYSATSRRYNYSLYFSDVRDPLCDRYSWRVWPEIDKNELNNLARLIVGNHDFSGICPPNRPGGSTIREVSVSHWDFDQDFLVYDIRANGFLFHMVRRLVGLQVTIYKQEMLIDQFTDCLNGKPPNWSFKLAPARGLTLLEVEYPS